MRYPNSIRELHRYRKFAAAAINLVNKSGTAAGLGLVSARVFQEVLESTIIHLRPGTFTV